jgi:hypothetical protein
MKLVNTALLFHPANWAIVFLMLAIAGVGITLVASSTDIVMPDAGDGDNA